MALPNNTIRFPAPEIDFDTQVGTTGQDHDNYPSKLTQARYDWMRLVIIGLLSCQSSDQEPTQYRDGTWWFDLGTNTMKIRTGNEWQPAAAVLAVADGLSLLDFYADYVKLKERVSKIETRVGM